MQSTFINGNVFVQLMVPFYYAIFIFLFPGDGHCFVDGPPQSSFFLIFSRDFDHSLVFCSKYIISYSS